MLNRNTENHAKYQLLISMILSGTLGTLMHYVTFPSSISALSRSLISTPFLLLMIRCKKEHLNFTAIRKNILLLFLTGMMIAGSWIFMFEAYKYAPVSVVTLCSYLSPIFLLIAAPVVLKEKISLKKCACVLVALVGVLIISGSADLGVQEGLDIRGILFSMGASLSNTALILLSKKIGDISPYDQTVVQFAMAGMVMFPYALLTGGFSQLQIDGLSLLMLLIIGIVNTGICYVMYFDAMPKVPAQTIAIYNYVPSLVAMVLSAVVLGERLTPGSLCGGLLILAAAVISNRVK